MFRRISAAILVIPVAILTSSIECTYLKAPEEFAYSADRDHRELSDRLKRFGEHMKAVLPGATAAADISTIERRNLVDDYIFVRMEAAGISPAPVTSDTEFLRRVTLDLTGRIPSADDVNNFLANGSPTKRDDLVDSLIASPEFVDKWTMFFGDLFKVNSTASNVTLYQQGRDAMVSYLRDAVGRDKPYNQIAAELITGKGDNLVRGEVNWVASGRIDWPVQDTYDGQAVIIGSQFLGINTVDCLLCHNGAGHLDTLNLWGKNRTRLDMWGLAAFFAQTQLASVLANQQPLYFKVVISDKSGEYQLNTKSGNRVARQPLTTLNQVAPLYPFTREAPLPDENRRQALAAFVTNDPQFARAIVNYVWEKMMVVAFVTPSNAFDPARLDPDNPPPAPWTLQPTNPELLNALALWFRDNGYDLRRLIGLIAKSCAYGLASAYPGEWKPDYVPYYARHYVRRLDAEEIHDAIVKATGVVPTYVMDYNGSLSPLLPVNWAMQFPDTREPRTNNAVVQFLNSFGRGDRDLVSRTRSASVLQTLNLMNNNFVLQRIHANNNGSTVQRLLSAGLDRRAIADNLFLATLSRHPTDTELTIALESMDRLGNTAGTEALQWALLNRLEFFHNY